MGFQGDEAAVVAAIWPLGAPETRTPGRKSYTFHSLVEFSSICFLCPCAFVGRPVDRDRRFRNTPGRSSQPKLGTIEWIQAPETRPCRAHQR